MRIGEIKIQSILLMYPSFQLRLDDTDEKSIKNAIFELKADSQIGDLLSSMVGSINRALSYIERRGLSRDRVVEITDFQSRDDVAVIDTSLIEGFLSLEKIIARYSGKETEPDVRVENGKIIAPKADSYKITYKEKIKRVSQISDEGEHLLIDNNIAELLPYFIKGELFKEENQQDAIQAMTLLEKEIDYLLMNKRSDGLFVEAIYRAD